MNILKKILILSSVILILAGCKNGKLPGADARKVSYDARERVKKNIEEGRGFRLSNVMKKSGGGNFDFASSNELWRASLDVIDFMPLASANYSGGMIITDWYSDNSANSNESLKITVRFLSNEIRSDSLKIVVHKKNCKISIDCNIALLPNSSKLNTELLSVILRKASLLEKESKQKNKKDKK